MRIFQTFLLPDNLVLKHRLSFAAANFSRNLVKGKGFDKVFSLMPLTVRDKLPQILDDGYEIIYSNWRKNWGFFSKLAIFHEQFKIYKLVQKGDSLWLYNLNIMNVLLFILIKLFKPSIKLNIIVLDLLPSKNWSNKNYWYLKLINSADGIICLSNSTLYTNKNIALLPGVVADSKVDFIKVDKPNKEFLLSGVISPAISSTSMVLDAFSQMPDCTLHITGNVLEGEDMIRDYAAKYKNIIFHGSVSFEDYLSLIHKITYQLSTRDDSFPENRCNFPSKIIESLLYNRIVISTITYTQLDGINYFKVDSNCDAFKRQILEICNKPNKILKKYANQGDNVKKKFSNKVWNNVMTNIENSSK